MGHVWARKEGASEYGITDKKVSKSDFYEERDERESHVAVMSSALHANIAAGAKMPQQHAGAALLAEGPPVLPFKPAAVTQTAKKSEGKGPASGVGEKLSTSVVIENDQRSGGTPASGSADATAPITAQPGSASSGEGARVEAVPSPAARAGVAFSSQHLADVLCAAFSTMQAMKGCLQTVQSKSEAFKAVKRSSRADGQYSKEQIAASISKCRPVSVTNAQELLSWLKVRAIEYECE